MADPEWCEITGKMEQPGPNYPGKSWLLGVMSGDRSTANEKAWPSERFLHSTYKRWIAQQRCSLVDQLSIRLNSKQIEGLFLGGEQRDGDPSWTLPTRSTSAAGMMLTDAAQFCGRHWQHGPCA